MVSDKLQVDIIGERVYDLAELAYFIDVLERKYSGFAKIHDLKISFDLETVE